MTKMTTGGSLREVYPTLDAALSALDRRSGDYSFDLERDLPWDATGEPGLFLPVELLRDLGYDDDVIARVRAEPEAWEMLQWASALLTCEGFIRAEQQVLDFFEWHPELLVHRSNTLLDEEERKHIKMFRRMADHLRERRPEWVFTFDRLFIETRCDVSATDLLASFDNERMTHLVFWLSLVYFEEVTIYLHVRLKAASDVQRWWRAAHECHMREEVQHLLTDAAHVQAMELTATERATLGPGLFSVFKSEMDRTFSVRVAQQMLAESFPELRFAPAMPASETAVFADHRTHPLFRRTRDLVLASVEEFTASVPA